MILPPNNKKTILGIFCFLLCLIWGCVLPGEQNKTQNRIDNLENKNQSLQKKNIELLGQNKRLKELVEKILSRLGTVQNQQKKLTDENKELYQKLYKERVIEQEKNKSEREKRIRELEEEARLLLENYTESKEEIKTLLMNKREALLNANDWQKEDEVQFVGMIEALDRRDLEPSEEEGAIQQALELDKQLGERLQKKEAEPQKLPDEGLPRKTEEQIPPEK